MKKIAVPVGFLTVLFLSATAVAVPTEITVRVMAKDAKFIGTSMGGAVVTIKDLQTGEILAKGITSGSTGNTGRIITTPIERGVPISDERTAKFSAVIDIDEPTQVEVTANGPLNPPQAANRVSATQWIVPGKHISEGDGWVLEIPGFAVDILDPTAHTQLKGVPKTLDVTINVVMMCGCPIEPGGLWDANGYEVKALAKRNGEAIGGFVLKYAGKTSQFAASFTVEEPGDYELTVYVYDPSNGNTGLDKVSFSVSE